MRTATSGINDKLTAFASQPGYLVRITTSTITYYLCTFDADFSYDAHVWYAADMQVGGFSWATGEPQAARLILGDADVAWWRVAAGGVSDPPRLQDAPVTIWQAYADVLDEAVPLWNGRIGGVRKDVGYIDCDLVSDLTMMSSPRRRVQSVIPMRYLIAPGTEIVVVGQTWVIERKSNG